MNMLPALVILSAIVAVTSTEDPYRQYRSCFEKTGFKEEQFNEVFVDLKYTNDEETLTKFLECCYVKYGVFNENGSFNMENFINNIINPFTMGNENMLKVYRKRVEYCTPHSKRSVSDKSIAIAKCVLFNIPIKA